MILIREKSAWPENKLTILKKQNLLASFFIQENSHPTIMLKLGLSTTRVIFARLV